MSFLGRNGAASYFFPFGKGGLDQGHMKPIYLMGCAIALAICSSSSVTFADVGTAPAIKEVAHPEYTTVKWVIERENELDVDGKKVIMHGKVTAKVNGDTYIFDDGTGTIKLDSDIHLPVGQTIVLTGHIDQAFLHIGALEINVNSFEIDKATR